MGRHADLIRYAADGRWSKMLKVLTGSPESGSFRGKMLNRSMRLASKVGAKSSSLRNKSIGSSSASSTAAEAAPTWSVDTEGCIERQANPAGLKVDSRDGDTGSTALTVAALGGHVAAVECLIAYSANVNAEDSRGNTPLHMAAWQERDGSEKVAELLLRNGARVDATNAAEDTPLHVAAQSGKVFVVMLIADAGANLHAENSAGETPLDVAARCKNTEAVRFLLNADRGLATSSTRALREAAKTGALKIAQALLDMGMDVGAADTETRDTALHEAVRYCRPRMAELLLKFGADAGAPNAEGETPQGIIESYGDSSQRTEILQLMDEYRDKEVAVPGIVLDERAARAAQQVSQQGVDAADDYKTGAKAHPPLVPPEDAAWLRDGDGFCSAFRPGAGPTQLLKGGGAKEDEEEEGSVRGGDSSSRKGWCAPGTGSQWCVVDFGSNYAITAVELMGMPGPEMPRELQLEVGGAKEGPWRTVKSFACAAADANDGGGGRGSSSGQVFAQYFAGFYAASRFWRLHVIRNHGAMETRLSGVRFYGMEMGLARWFAEQKLTRYLNAFVEAGYNRVAELGRLGPSQLEELVTLAGHRKKVQMAIRELTGDEVERFDRLVFSRPPSRTVRVATPLPMFEVQAGPGLSDAVEVVLLGPSGMLSGTVRKRLEPNGAHNPSTCFFDDVTITPPGNYRLAVRSVTRPEAVVVRAAHPTAVEPPPTPRSALEVLFADHEALLSF